MICKITSPYKMRYGEFPDLLFGKSVNGAHYFDFTHYITQQGDENKHSVEDFVLKFKPWFEAVSIAYELSPDEIIATDQATGHILIDESLALLFVSYVDADFCIYIIERLSEVLLNGVALSDTSILQMVKGRFSIEYLLTIIKEHEK